MITIDPSFITNNQKIFENSERKAIRSNFIFYVPYHILLDTEDEFEIRLPKNPEKQHFLKVINRTAYTLDHNHKFLGFSEVKDDDKLKTVLFRNGDRFGLTGYSQVLINYDRFFDIFDSQNNVDGLKIEKALEKVCEIYNYFLDIYAAVVKHRQVMKISPHDIHTLDFFHFDGINKHNETRLFTMNGATITSGFVSPKETVITRLKELLISADQNLHLCGLGVNAVRNLFGGEYLSAIVQAVTQLESFIYAVFQEKLKNKDIKDIDKMLGRLGLSNLLEILTLVLTDQEISGIKSKVDFSKVVQSINARNKYIHEGIDVIGISSFEKAEEFVNEINDLCVELGKIVGIDHSLNEEKNGWDS